MNYRDISGRRFFVMATPFPQHPPGQHKSRERQLLYSDRQQFIINWARRSLESKRSPSMLGFAPRWRGAIGAIFVLAIVAAMLYFICRAV
jgi:hypothetical protein